MGTDDSAEVEGVTPWISFKTAVRRKASDKLRSIKCSGECMKSSMVGLFPILDWLVHYDIKKNLLGDVISGELEISFLSLYISSNVLWGCSINISLFGLRRMHRCHSKYSSRQAF